MGSQPPADITIYQKGQEPETIPGREIRTFDLRLSGYTAAEFLDTSKPLGQPRYATLKVWYLDGGYQEWSFHQEGFVTEAENGIATGYPSLAITADRVTKLIAPA